MLPGVVHNLAPLGQETFWRDEELLVVEEDADHDALRAELEGRGYDAAAGVRRYRLPGRQVDELVSWLRKQPGPAPRVSVNHLFAAQHRPPWSPHGHETYHFANFEKPRPAAPPSGFLTASEPGPVGVGILDTEVDHPLLRERTLVLGQPPEQTGLRTDEAVGHGVLVAGLIARRAPQARLVVGPVMDGNGVVEEFLVIQALDRPELWACPVLNISFAGYTEDDQPPPALSTVLDQYVKQNGVVVAAAGNGGESRARWPAALPRVVAVGALDASGTRWRHSDHGPWVDVWASGVDVISTYLDAGWAEWSGTSAAAAQVCGAITALIDQGVEPGSAARRLVEAGTLVAADRQLPEARRDARHMPDRLRGGPEPHPHRKRSSMMGTITTTDGTEIFYKDWGNGQPVVFSHGWPLNADAWDDQAMLVAANGYRAIAHDRRGHGRSSQPWNGNDLDTYADDLAQLLEQLDLREVVLVGHSTGGGEVTRYLGRHGSDRVAKAVLLGAIPPLMLKTDANPLGTPIEAFDAIRAGVLGDRSQFYKELSVPFYGANRPGSTVSEGVRDAFWLWSMQVGLKGAYDCIKAFSETDLTEDLRRIDVPTLIIHGDDDQIVPIDASARRSVELVKDASLKVYPGAPHGLAQVAPYKDQFNADLLDFLNG
jgi:non-heme chloroperoxidase